MDVPSPEIATLAQEFEYGYKPNPPYSATTGSRSGNTLTVTVNDNGRTISFNASITYPSAGTAPYPPSSVSGLEPEQLGALQPGRGHHQLAERRDRAAERRGLARRGLVLHMYGSGHSAGA